MRPIVTGAGASGGHVMDKQSLVPMVQELWNEWEIHILILVSLSLQVFLFLFGGMRRRSSWWLLRGVLWLAYLSADAVAVFVLGHLAVRAREPGHQLVSFWAPFVLVHLGGQDTITAFAKQDNELWGRHLLNLVIQVAVAGYVVSRASWPDARLRAAMVIMFLCGCFKYAERTGCLFSADTGLRGFTQRILSQKLEGMQHKRGNTRLSRAKGTREEAKQEMKETLELMTKGSSSGSPNAMFWDAAVTLVVDIISVDSPLNHAQKITAAAHGDLPGLLDWFLSRENRYSAYEHVGALLEYCFRRLYTKDPVREVQIVTNDDGETGCLSWASALFLNVLTITATSVSLALFRATEKKGQLHNSSKADITITYLLLVGAIALDVSSVTIFIFRHLSFRLPCLAKPIRYVSSCCTQQWSQKLGQYNIISTVGLSEPWQLLGYDVKRTPITKDHTCPSIKEFILDTLLVSGTRGEWNIASTRGKLALHHKWMERHQEHDGVVMTTRRLESLEETVRSSTDFPTSVLILHIATDICYHYGGGSGSGSSSGSGTNSSSHQAVVKWHKQTSTELSNYIMYLVFKCGVMLTTSSQIVHGHACKDIAKELSHHPKDQPGNTDGDAMKLFEAIKKQQQEDSMGEIQVSHQESDSTIEVENKESTDIDDDNAIDDHVKKLKRISKTLKSPVLPRAVAVAEELISINNEAERWDLIAAVWAEMLYYTAPRCGGRFHYEHLSTGGEFVSHVLLLMYYLGPFLPPPPDA